MIDNNLVKKARKQGYLVVEATPPSTGIFAQVYNEDGTYGGTKYLKNIQLSHDYFDSIDKQNSILKLKIRKLFLEEGLKSKKS